MRAAITRVALAAVMLLLAGPLAADAQGTARVYRIGVVSIASEPSSRQAFRDGLRELGDVEGRNVIVEIERTGGGLCDSACSHCSWW